MNKNISIIGILTLLMLVLAVEPLVSQALAKEIMRANDRIGILVMTPEDKSTVYMKPGDKLPFRVAVPDYVKVKRATLFLCGSSYEMKPVEKWGSMVIYGVDVKLPPRNDLYTWHVVFETDQGSVASSKYKTMVVFNTTGISEDELEQLKALLQEAGNVCPILPPPSAGDEASGADGSKESVSLGSEPTSYAPIAAALAVAAIGAVVIVARKGRVEA